MATTTTNFGWTVPQSTDLVKDGATAIAALGSGVDTSFVDLKGGTTGQLLSKASGTDLDYTWVDPSTGDITGVTAGTGISGGGTSGTVTVTNSMATAIDAKGDLIAGTGADAFSRLAVGTNGQILTADSTEATGIKWATPATSSSGLTFISKTSWSAAASVTVDNVFTSTYQNYLIVINDWVGSAYNIIPQMQMRYGSSTSGSVIYGSSFGMPYSGGSLVVQSTTAEAALNFWRYIGDGSGSFISVNVERVGTGSGQKALVNGIGVTDAGCEQYKFAGIWTDIQAYTGFVLKTSSGTSTGNVSVYGYAKA